MNAWWAYFWPVFAAGLIAGFIGPSIAYRRPERRNPAYVGAVLAAIVFAALWHGPLGAADRFISNVESNVRLSLTSWEMPQVHGHLQRGPLTRRVVLAGPADDFQRSELVRIIDTVPGVSGATWQDSGGLPLIVEGIAAAVLGFLLGWLLAYLVELRRRHNMQWNW